MMDAVIDEVDGRMIRIGEHWLADWHRQLHDEEGKASGGSSGGTPGTSTAG